MLNLRMPSSDLIYSKQADTILFNQLAVKIEMDPVSNDQYYAWLDDMKSHIGSLIPGAEIVEKPTARSEPPLNVAIYYDTPDYRILPTGSLLRTSCNRITHAFCAFKLASDRNSVRSDFRYVFEGDEKKIIQEDPASERAVAIVQKLLARTDIEHPGVLLKTYLGIEGKDLIPAIRLDDYRYTFFLWIDKKDALRCSIDRAFVSSLRSGVSTPEVKPVSEVELAIYPHVAPEMSEEPRVVESITMLGESLCARFGVCVTQEIKYQRAARTLGIVRTFAS